MLRLGKSRCASLMNGLMTASSSNANERGVSQLTRGIRSRVRARYAQNPIKSTSLSSWTLQTERTQVSTSRESLKVREAAAPKRTHWLRATSECQMMGRPPTLNKGLGKSSDKGRKRVPVTQYAVVSL